MDHRCIGGERGVACGYRVKGAVIDIHQRRKILRSVTIRRKDEGDRLSDITHPIHRQEFRQHLADTGMPARDEQRALDKRQITRREDGQRASLHRGLDIDGGDLCMGMRAAHEHGVNHPIKVDVVHEAALTRQQPTVFDPKQSGFLFCHAINSLTKSARQTAASLRR